MLETLKNHIITPVYAVDPAIGQLQPPTSKITDPTQIGSIATVLISAVVVVAGLYALMQLILAGIAYIGTSGDAKKANDAKQRIYYSIIGLVVIAASFIILRIVSQLLFGVDFIKNPTLKTL